MKTKLLSLLLFFTVILASTFLAAQTTNQEPPTYKEFTSFPSEAIENISSNPLKNGFEVNWNINYEKFNTFKEAGYSVVIAYNTKLNAERLKNDYKTDPWKVVENIDITATSYKIKDLVGDEDYVFRIGIKKEDQTYWSAKNGITTNAPWGVFGVLVLLGSLALFLYGMKIMSDGLQQAAGAKLRGFLGSMTSSPFKGVLTGFGITSIIQSSSITTVMTVSFVNAGILTIMQSAGVVMGANIGTTVTAWMVNLFGFKVDIGPYTLIMLAIGLPLLFMSRSRTKGWANAIIGFALLFMGLEFMEEAVPTLSADSGIVQFFTGLNDIPVISTIIFILFGALLTLMIQSSSATIALTMTLLVSGIIPFEAAAAMVLGENIGTTITAEIAAAVGNVHAKRTARIHSTFNIVGVTIAVIIFPFFLDLVVYLTGLIDGGNPILNSKEYGTTGLAILHTTFNVLNVSLWIWFVPFLVNMAEKTVKAKGSQDEMFQLDYINTVTNATSPSLSILEVKKEIAKFGDLTKRMSGFSRTLLIEKNRKEQRKLLKKIKKYEEITDKVEIEIANFLYNVGAQDPDKELAIRISGMNRIASDLERIGDIFYQISKIIEKKVEDKVSFTSQQYQRLDEMFDLIDEAFEVMCENLNKHSYEVTIDKAKAIETKIDKKRDEMRKEYYDAMIAGDKSSIGGGVLYSNIFGSLERVGDHIINVTEGVMGEL